MDNIITETLSDSDSLEMDCEESEDLNDYVSSNV